MDDHEWAMGGRQLAMSEEDAQMEATTQSSKSDDDELVVGTVSRVPMPAEERRHATQYQHYADLDFADRRPIPPPPSDMFVVAYAEIGQA